MSDSVLLLIRFEEVKTSAKRFIQDSFAVHFPNSSLSPHAYIHVYYISEITRVTEEGGA